MLLPVVVFSQCLLERHFHRWQAHNRIAKCSYFPWSSTPGRGFTRESLDIPYSIKSTSHRLAYNRISGESGYGVESIIYRIPVRQRCKKPLPEKSGAHWSERSVEYPNQGPAFFSSS